MIPVGPFDLTSPLSAGGMGAIWRAVHRPTGLPVAVKVMTGAPARQARFVRAFGDEARSMAALDHPGIAMVFDYGRLDAVAEEASGGKLERGSPFLVMELASGGSLDRATLPASWRAIRRLVLALLDALAHAHARGVLHRDLKPGNLLWCGASDARPGLKLADFGLAHAVEESWGMEGPCGTPVYMAPEQFGGDWRDLGPWTDLYAVGCIAWEWVTGRAPYEGLQPAQLSRYHRTGELPRFVPRMPVPPRLEWWLRGLLEKRPARRARRAADAALALVGLGDAEGEALSVARGAEPRPTLVAPASEAPDTVVPGQTALDSGLVTLTLDAVEGVDEAPLAALGPFPKPPLPSSWRQEEPRMVPPGLAGAGLGLFGLREIPLVDREWERDVLWEVLDRTLGSGRAGVAVLRGPAGTGKSRLARWLVERAHEVGAIIPLRAAHAPIPTPADGLAGLVARHLRCAGLQGQRLAQRVWTVLGEAGLAGDALAVRSLLAAGDEPSSGGFASARERHAPVLRLVERRAAERGVVLWAEDVQWGADLLAFVRWLLDVQGERPMPVLVLLTVQDETLSDRPAEADALQAIESRPECTRIDVRPLPPHASTELARRLLPLDPTTVEELAARTAGHPLFAVQLVRDWVQRGALVAGADGFTLDRRLPLPDDLHQLWTERLHGVLSGGSQGDGVALEVAAALGGEVEEGEWWGVCRALDVAPDPDLVERLVGRGLARRRGESWGFAHGLLRESLLRRAREAGRLERIHRACGERLRGAPALAVRARGALHLRAAEDPAALGELLAVAEAARVRGEFGLVHELLDARLELLRALEADPEDRAFAEDESIRASTLLLQGRPLEAAPLAERVLERTGAGRRWPDLYARALRSRAVAHEQAGELEEAERLNVRAFQQYRALGDASGACGVLCGLGWVARALGDPAASRGWYERALDAGAGLGDSPFAGAARMGLAWWYADRGEHEPARALLAEAIAMLERLGSRADLARAWSEQGELERSLGRLEEAARCYRQAIDLSTAIGSAWVDLPRGNLGLCLLQQGAVEEAEGLLQSAASSFERRGLRAFAAVMRTGLAGCAAGRGDWASFDLRLGASIEALRAVGVFDPDAIAVLETAAAAAEAAGEASRARAAWAAVAEQADGLGRAEAAEEARRRL